MLAAVPHKTAENPRVRIPGNGRSVVIAPPHANTGELRNQATEILA
jgi:hypothetical protein